VVQQIQKKHLITLNMQLGQNLANKNPYGKYINGGVSPFTLRGKTRTSVVFMTIQHCKRIWGEPGNHKYTIEKDPCVLG
jgi:hypothetical protein